MVRSGRCGPRAHRGREAEADRAEVARHQHLLAGLALEVPAERVRVVAHVDRDDGVLRGVAGERLEQAVQTRRRGRGRRACAGSSPRARSRAGSRRRRAGRRARLPPRSLESRRCRAVTAMSPSTGAVTGWKRPIASGSESTWMIGLYGAIPVWFANEAPNTISRSDSFISHDATGVPLRPSTPQASGCVVGDDPLGLERGEDRRVQALGQAHDVVDAATRAVPHDDDGPARARDERVGLLDRGRGGRDREIGDAPTRATGPRAVGRGERLHLVGQHEVGDAALVERVLAREVHELDLVGVAVHRLGRDRDVGERGGEIEVLERAPTAHLRRHLTRDREHRRAVDLGVVQTGEQVGGARTGDREARGQAAGQLAVRARRERGRALVADADEREVAARLGLAHRVGEAEVRVPDHPEDVGDAPRAHRLDHQIGDRARPAPSRGPIRRTRRRRAPRPDAARARR